MSSFLDSSNVNPIIFILSPGVDPSGEVFKFADEQKMGGSKLYVRSLGQGQGPFAEEAIREAVDKGTWVLLQNCHLATSWMPSMAKIVDEINPQTTNPDFRLWLTSAPSPEFPVSVLQIGVKMTNEPPKGIKQNLAATFRPLTEDWFATCKQPEVLKKLMFGLGFFHAIVQERRKFGPPGWNIPYEFNNSDKQISQKQLKMFLDFSEDTPFTALRYLFGQLNYGGRVTDDWDRRCITAILEDYMSDFMLDDDYKFSVSGSYFAPQAGSSVDDIRAYIETLPLHEEAEVFSMHRNVVITAAMKEERAMSDVLLLTIPRVGGGGGGATREEIVDAMAKDIEAKLPDNFDIEMATAKFPLVYEESMNTVLVQELIRFNKLLSRVKETLKNVQRAIKGEVVMSAELEHLANSLEDGKVPDLWKKVSYPSLKPLGSYVNDLLQRLMMFQTWMEDGAPANYWISGFFFTQSFLTGTLQNYARKYSTAIDQCSFDFEVHPGIGPLASESPVDGCYIHGLFLEGGRWDLKQGVLVDPKVGQLFSEMPTIWLKPMPTVDIDTEKVTYKCPVYKTSARHGVLTTTGHSSNFVLPVKLPSAMPEKYWVKRGTAMLTGLDY